MLPSLVFGFVNETILTIAGNVIVPATLVILTSFDDLISVSSLITLLLDLPNSSNIIRPLWF